MTDNFDVDADVYQGVDFERIAENALDSVAVEVQNNWQDTMDQAGYRNTGETINSITIAQPEQFVRLIGSDKTAALIGEVGRAPGAGHPPPDRLGDWVHEQAGLPDRGGSVEWSFGGETQTVSFDQVVFLIGRSIDENGLEAHHFGERAANDATPLDEAIAERIEMALERQSTG